MKKMVDIFFSLLLVSLVIIYLWKWQSEGTLMWLPGILLFLSTLLNWILYRKLLAKR
ncbi:hypothetical protein [Enterococcus canis]|uniref:hypothetical protein n=1 Tax=Enterococcus canis TaxID=214095 RepID=UPI000A652F72|nr:hypothetical protein [Enterococcus canis]